MIEAIVAGVFTVIGIIIGQLLSFWKERKKTREEEIKTIQLKYLNPLRLYCVETHFRLSEIENRINKSELYICKSLTFIKDHLEVKNKDFPVFVLAFCIFEKSKYSQSVVSKLKKFKFKHFGHDMVILHENEIRRDKGWFKILNTKEKKNHFLNELTNIIEDDDFTLISTVIEKDKLKSFTKNPYDIALRFCIQSTYLFLESKKQNGKVTHIVVEQRGKKEDFELESEFKKICDEKNNQNKNLPLEIVMANKLSNSAGLQFADLVARPIGLSIFKSRQENRAFEILKTKFYKDDSGNINGLGLQVIP